MNNIFRHNTNIKKSFYTLIVVLIAILFYRYTENMEISSFLPGIFKVMAPFIIGAITAYVLNSGMKGLEEKVLLRFKFFQKRKKWARTISLTISLMLLLGVILGIIGYIVPEIIQSAQSVIEWLGKINLDDVREQADKILTRYGIEITESTYNTIIGSIRKFIDNITDQLKYIPDMFSKVVAHVIGFASSAINVIIGIMVAIYLLSDKEFFIERGKKTLYLFFNDNNAKVIIDTVKKINSAFNGFFLGKAIDSLIIGIIFYIGAVIMQFPYPSLCALVIGITNMIPYFGPFIGAVPVVVLIILTEPVKALWCTIFIVCLQQFDGIILGPKILGDSIGMKPLGVIFSIIVGGAVAGPLGMFFGVPIFAVVFTMFEDAVDKVYSKKKGIPLVKAETAKPSPEKKEKHEKIAQKDESDNKNNG